MPLPRPVHIVVADDHPIVLHGIITLLRNDSSFIIDAICRNGAEAIEAIQKHPPDLALLDIIMPKHTGLDVLKAMNGSRVQTRVVFLAASPSDSEIVTAREEGAYGIILKE